MSLSRKDLYRITPVVTRNQGLYGLIEGPPYLFAVKDKREMLKILFYQGSQKTPDVCESQCPKSIMAKIIQKMVKIKRQIF